MEILFALLIALLVACGVYLVMERNLIRFVFGFILLGNAVNLIIFMVGGLTPARPPIIKNMTQVQGVDAGVDALMGAVSSGLFANPLPQALILTAIVISFGLLSFTLVLILKTYSELHTLDTHAMRFAEPKAMTAEKQHKIKNQA